MGENELQEFDLEDILKEFGNSEESATEEETEEVSEQNPDAEAFVQLEETGSKASAEATTDKTAPDLETTREFTPVVTGDTIRLDAIPIARGQVRDAVLIKDEEPEEIQPKEEPFSEQWEPEYEQPIGEYIAPQPIIFHPRSRLRELKRKLVAGPEKRYYILSEKGLGKLQAAIFLSFLVVLLSAASTAMYALGMVQENRMRLMVFGQFFAMLVSALLGSYQLIEGVTDLFKKRFTLNTLLVITFLACCVDGILCLQQVRVPCCAAFSLEVTMSLWSEYQKRHAEMGQMDTMRKAIRLDSLCAVKNYYGGRTGFVRGEGQVEDFMDTYNVPSTPQKVMDVYAIAALLASICIGVTAGVAYDLYAGIQVFAVSLLAAVPASFFITLSRPMALLGKRLHSVGTVLCGWKGITSLCGKVVFPLNHEDLFPVGTTRLNGVKFYGSRDPDEIVAYCTALISADGGGLANLFVQLLDSRNAHHYDAQELQTYGNGGIGGVVQGEPILVGTLSFLKEMGVEVPEGIRVSQAVCVAIDGEFSGLFAVTYEKTRASAAGLAVLSSYGGLKPILTTADFMLTGGFIRAKFGINPKRILLPDYAIRHQLRSVEAQPEDIAGLLVTKEGLLPYAYGVTGARALRTASILGVVIHMIGGILGIGVVVLLTLLNARHLLTPANMFLYQLIWMIPGMLITEWTRTA